MRLFIILTSIVIILYLFNKFLLWLESNGWLYYKHSKQQGDLSSMALLEMSKHLSPGNQNTIEMLQAQRGEELKTSNASNDTKYHT